MGERRETWEIILHAAVDAWYLTLCDVDGETASLVSDALDTLAAEGPTLGRPLVDRITGSRLHKLKELRPGSSGASEIRLLFAFDERRRALVVVAGDKAGQWRAWYRAAIPLAEARYAQMAADLNEEDPR